jgi:hypothetical protein
MNARLDNRVTEPDRVVTTLVVVAAALYLAFAGWLITFEVSNGGPPHVATVNIDNQTHLTLEVELGAHQPGLTSRSEVADLGPSWTFEASYGSRRVDRQTLDRAALARQGWTVHIPATATTALERAGYKVSRHDPCRLLQHPSRRTRRPG